MSDRSRRCDEAKHAECDGLNRVIDQDGNSAYVCSCSCHTERSTCANCGRPIQRQKGAGGWTHGSYGSDLCARTRAIPEVPSVDQ